MEREAHTPGRVVGWVRPDITGEIWLTLPLCILLTAGGALMVGYGYGRLEQSDPAGLHRDARSAARDDTPPVHPPRERGQGESAETMWLLFGAGFLLVASGPALVIILLRRLWSRDEFLLLRTDALVSSVDGHETTIPWDHIAAIRFDTDTGEVALEMREGVRRILEPRLVDDGESLAKHLEDVRRKATWNLLPQQRS